MLAIPGYKLEDDTDEAARISNSFFQPVNQTDSIWPEALPARSNYSFPWLLSFPVPLLRFFSPPRSSPQPLNIDVVQNWIIRPPFPSCSLPRRCYPILCLLPVILHVNLEWSLPNLYLVQTSPVNSGPRYLISCSASRFGCLVGISVWYGQN